MTTFADLDRDTASTLVRFGRGHVATEGLDLCVDRITARVDTTGEPGWLVVEAAVRIDDRTDAYGIQAHVDVLSGAAIVDPLRAKIDTEEGDLDEQTEAALLALVTLFGDAAGRVRS